MSAVKYRHKHARTAVIIFVYVPDIINEKSATSEHL